MLPKDPNDDKNVIVKLEVVQVVTKQIFLLATFIECTLVMLKEDAGKLKLCL